MLTFRYRGGTQVQDNKTYKFLVLAVNPPEEFMLYDALKKGMVHRDHEAEYSAEVANVEADNPTALLTPYMTDLSIFKVFTAQSGFGLAKKYVSFFVRLDDRSNTLLTIRPFGYEDPQKNKAFEARGRFLSPAEIEASVSPTTFSFYQKQTFLSNRELSEMVTVRNLTEAGQLSTEVRKLRF